MQGTIPWQGANASEQLQHCSHVQANEEPVLRNAPGLKTESSDLKQNVVGRRCTFEGDGRALHAVLCWDQEIGIRLDEGRVAGSIVGKHFCQVQVAAALR